MAIEVYGWRKPTLELELVEGGTLLANTTYYICGFMQFTPFVYNNVSSPLSDIYTITTTTTAKSIKITQKTYRSITAFTDNGNGTTNVTCPLHCVKTGDVIKINTGSYAGSWTITKIDKDTFSIPTAYIDNVAVVCYTDSVTYNKATTGRTSSTGMVYYVSIINPLTGGFLNRFTDYPHTMTTGLNNPSTITAQPALGNSIYVRNLTVQGLNAGMTKNLAENYGTIYVFVSSTETFKTIYDAIILAGFTENCTYRSDMFILVGTLHLNNTASVTATDLNITIICGELASTISTNFNLPRCLVSIMPSQFSMQTRFNLENGCFYNTLSSITTDAWIYGNNITLFSSPRTTNGDGTVHYVDTVTGVTKTIGLMNSKTYKATNDYGYVQISYNNTQIINSSVYSLHWSLMKESAGTNPNIYMMENSTIDSLLNGWHFRFYTNPEALPYQSHLKFLNIDTNDPNNIKKCVNNISGNLTASFYRRMEFYITDEIGNPIESASITLTDNIGTVYTGSTDLNGYSYIDYLEQTYIIDESMGPQWSWNGSKDTYYQITNIEITAVGHPLYEQSIIDNISTYNVIALQDPEYVYVDKITVVENLNPLLLDENISTDISTDNISISIINEEN